MPIEIKNLCYSYKQGTPFEKKVLHNVNLSINDGEFIGLIGPTQSGKTTLAQHCNALIIPQKGRVVVNGCDTAEKNANLTDLRQNVGYVFQNPDYQLFAPTVGEDIAFGPVNQKLGRDEINNRVREAMEQVGLDYNIFYKRDIFALSGGQKRRAAIAGVLACRPRVMILDDVTAGLDPRGREEILAVVRKLHEEKMLTIIFISNSMDEVAMLADRIAVLDKGHIIIDDTTKSVFGEAEKLQQIGLELPEVMEITGKLREYGFKLPQTLITLDEVVELISADLQGKQVGE
ncbi:MAG: energy-coupling factor transporter ATPase [Dethiobacteria bacterium]|nr:energy-coupling factor transporter ATPase [Bacillota bacterium]MDW7728410.1 energy-coupling factor transporter ATPase [Bacillota bacterium]